ncbi:hypothetical protein MM236_16055 [Belliella sp. DSM 107340]|uniref:Uncharacterized protein n=1 Tax=Belliella calami TaxID=2923436 RepID=A0ABS9UTD5_9BACT|nr:hypothetical protein [Belliella calami]MCH7399518.1 hypothetical protein [Belliella calami]
MKNTTKLVIANVFALISVVVFLLLGNMYGLEFKDASTSLLSKALLVLIPQLGFIYLYWMSLKENEEKEADFLN